MTVTDDRPQVEIPEPLACPDGCTTDHSANQDLRRTGGSEVIMHSLFGGRVRLPDFYDVAVYVHQADVYRPSEPSWLGWVRRSPELIVSLPKGILRAEAEHEVGGLLGVAELIRQPALESLIREAAAVCGWVFV